MTNQSSIKYISSLLEKPGSITDGDQSSISLFRQTFPYFVPVRYMLALETHKKTPFSPQMLSSTLPYVGDWMLFCDFLAEGSKPIDGQLAAVNKVVEKKSAEVYRAHTEHETVSIPKASPVIPSAVKVDEVKKQPEAEGIAPKAVAHEQPVIPIPTAVEEKKQEPVVPAMGEPVVQTPPPPVVETKVEVPPPVPEPPPVAPATPEIMQEAKTEEIPVAPAPAPVEEPKPEPAPIDFESEPVIIEIFMKPDQVLSAEEAALFAEPVFSDSAEAPEHIITDDTLYVEIIADNSTQPVSEPAKEESIEEAVEIVHEASVNDRLSDTLDQDPLIFPIYTKDYFLQQGEKVSDEIPLEINELKDTGALSDEDKSLMVVMSFSEWLLHFKNSSEKQMEESKDQKALKTMWQKEKLAAAIEEENEEIPETVFEMAVNSISKEEGLVSETLAEIYIKQGKYDKAVEMYRKLSLKNPQKSAYFAHKIDEALKDKQS